MISPKQQAFAFLAVLISFQSPTAALAEEGSWPPSYSDFCGAAGYGKNVDSFALRMNRSNQRLKNDCTDMKKLQAWVRQNASHCAQGGALAKQFEQRLSRICGDANSSAKRAYELCRFYDAQGIKAENDVNAVAAKLNQSQSGTVLSAINANKLGRSYLENVKMAASSTQTSIAKKLPAKTTNGSASASDPYLESILKKFSSIKNSSQACQNLEKALKLGNRTVTNRLFPNMRVLADGAASVGQNAEERIQNLKSNSAKLEETHQKLINTYPDFNNVKKESY